MINTDEMAVSESATNDEGGAPKVKYIFICHFANRVCSSNLASFGNVQQPRKANKKMQKKINVS